MPRYIVDDTEADSLASSRIIEERARPVYAGAGYEIDATGAIVGVNVATKTSDPTAQKTERYAVPEQRLDGKWVIPHPECMPSRDYVVVPATETAPAVVLVDHLMAGLPDAVVEEYDSAWFPPKPGLPGGP